MRHCARLPLYLYDRTQTNRYRMKKIGIALTLLLCVGASTYAQNSGQLKQAQVSTARQTP